jgi:hypothetical protein
MMRYAAPFLGGGLGRADIEAAIDLRGIAGHHFAAQLAGKRDGHSGLARCRRADNGNEWKRIAHSDNRGIRC